MTDKFLDANPKFREVASINAEPSNWSDEELEGWIPAKKVWQTFANKWRNIDDKVFHPESGVLDLGRVPQVDTNYPILVRDCYVKAEKVVWERATRPPRAGVIFTGQPGIGKTVFIWYLLVRLLKMQQPVLLYLTSSTALLFWGNAVYIAPSETADPPSPSNNSASFVWSLIDFEDDQQPPRLATSPRWCFPVQAPPPRPDRYEIWRKRRNPLLTGFPSWTCEELTFVVRLDSRFQVFREYFDKHWKDSLHRANESEPYYGAVALIRETYTEQTPKSSNEAFDILLRGLISRCGPIPRDIIAGMYDFLSLERTHSVQLKELEAIVLELARERQFSDTTSSHRVVMINFTGEVGKIEGWEVKFKSNHIGRLFSERLVEESENETRSFIKRFSPIPEGRCIAGTLFEALVHRDITRGTGSWSFWKMPLQRNEPSDSVKFVYDASAVRIDGFPKIQRQQVRFANNELPERLVSEQYYVPLDLNFPSIDSFIVQFNFFAGSAHLWVLKIGTSENHEPDGSDNGNVEIHKIVETIGELLEKHASDQPPPRKKLRTQGGKPLVPVHYVLVCPDSQVEPGLKWELPKGWYEGIEHSDHRGDGYLLKFHLVPERRS